MNLIPQEEEEEALDDEEAQEEEEVQPQDEHPKRKELSDEQIFGVYFALQVIEIRDGSIQLYDKLLVAILLSTSVRTVERIWLDAKQ